MNEIRDLLANWNSDVLNNPESLASAYQAIVLLVNKVEALEAEVAQLKA